jgi:hypothetical protein
MLPVQIIPYINEDEQIYETATLSKAKNYSFTKNLKKYNQTK